MWFSPEIVKVTIGSLVYLPHQLDTYSDKVNSKSINLLILSQFMVCLFELYVFIALAQQYNELILICRIKALKTL